MFHCYRYFTIALLLTLFVIYPVRASILWDYDPEVYGSSSDIMNYGNQSNIQNFAEKIQFDTDVSLTGMDIWGYNGTTVFPNSYSYSATLRFWNDVSGQPGSIFNTFQEEISDFETIVIGNAGIRKMHVDFSIPVILNKNIAYWVGMSGSNYKNIALMGLKTNSPGDGKMVQFHGRNNRGFIDSGDMAFRLYGTVMGGSGATPTPEPSTMVLFGIGLLGFARICRRIQ